MIGPNSQNLSFVSAVWQWPAAFINHMSDIMIGCHRLLRTALALEIFMITSAHVELKKIFIRKCSFPIHWPLSLMIDPAPGLADIFSCEELYRHGILWIWVLFRKCLLRLAITAMIVPLSRRSRWPMRKRAYVRDVLRVRVLVWAKWVGAEFTKPFVRKCSWPLAACHH